MLVGLPGSGKTTWIKNYQWVRPTRVLASDTIIENVASQYGYTYDQVFKELISFADKVFWCGLREACAYGTDIIVDRTNLSLSSRKKVLDIVKCQTYTPGNTSSNGRVVCLSDSSGGFRNDR